ARKPPVDGDLAGRAHQVNLQVVARLQEPEFVVGDSAAEIQFVGAAGAAVDVNGGLARLRAELIGVGSAAAARIGAAGCVLRSGAERKDVGAGVAAGHHAVRDAVPGEGAGLADIQRSPVAELDG